MPSISSFPAATFSVSQWHLPLYLMPGFCIIFSHSSCTVYHLLLSLSVYALYSTFGAHNLGISLLSFFWIFPHSISIYSLTTFSLSVNALNSTLIDVIFFYHSMATLSFLSFCCTLVQSISISSTTSLSNFLFLCRNVVEITKSTFPPITAKS